MLISSFSNSQEQFLFNFPNCRCPREGNNRSTGRQGLCFTTHGLFMEKPVSYGNDAITSLNPQSQGSLEFPL